MKERRQKRLQEQESAQTSNTSELDEVKQKETEEQPYEQTHDVNGTEVLGSWITGIVEVELPIEFII